MYCLSNWEGRDIILFLSLSHSARIKTTIPQIPAHSDCLPQPPIPDERSTKQPEEVLRSSHSPLSSFLPRSTPQVEYYLMGVKYDALKSSYLVEQWPRQDVNTGLPVHKV